MAKLNAELPIICNHVLSVDEAATGETQEGMDLVAQFCRVIGRIVQLPGIRFKLVGNELYASGNTYPVRQDLRGAGMSFSPKKQAWFIRFDAPGAMSLGSYVSSQK